MNNRIMDSHLSRHCRLPQLPIYTKAAEQQKKETNNTSLVSLNGYSNAIIFIFQCELILLCQKTFQYVLQEAFADAHFCSFD